MASFFEGLGDTLQDLMKSDAGKALFNYGIPGLLTLQGYPQLGALVSSLKQKADAAHALSQMANPSQLFDQYKIPTPSWYGDLKAGRENVADNLSKTKSRINEAKRSGEIAADKARDEKLRIEAKAKKKQEDAERAKREAELATRESNY